MTARLVRLVALVPVFALVTASPLLAQSLGSFSWQLQPFCSYLTVNITQQGTVYTVDGYDDQCGGGQRGPLVGTATQNPDGTIGLGLHVITVPGGRPVDIDARISLQQQLNGTWSDSAGNSGAFGYLARTGGSPRPLPTIPGAALAPVSVTAAQLAPASVTTAKIADGSITAQKLAFALPKLASSGLTTGMLALAPLNTSIVVRTVSMAIPAAGQVMANASGLFDFLITNSSTQFIWCSITTGTTVETAHYIYGRVDQSYPNAVTNMPFAGTRVFSVSPGVFNVNLVCAANGVAAGLEPSLQTVQLTALFVPS